ncbi:TlpA disulfide reductase family protein [Microtetraspora fusca]|uniref:TlpA disulfide reductase family protein n=1 Tax=Microtetraspora fusca TaxID=1997 RepID=A0ABW6V3E0_MICFU|nr:TlpA disulfide reductase family protein [Microtetraspora fusca]
MPFLIAAVVLVGVVCLVDLVLTVGVIRRLREHTEFLTTLGREAPGLGVGEEVGPFAVHAADGGPLTRDHLTRETLFGFFSPDCEPCKAKLPAFVRYAAEMPGGRDRVVAVIAADEGADGEFRSRLGEVARVVVEDHTGPLSAAFRVRAYPSLFLVAPDGAGRVVVTTDAPELSRAVGVA